MKKIMVVFGTRPEAIKMCPVVNALNQKGCFDVVVCVTGQHRQMLDQVLEAFDITPDIDMSIMKEGQTLFDITQSIISKMRSVLLKEKPDLVLVHGDTSTAFAAALACFYFRVKVGHVEAGLRTYDNMSPYPEEFNRQAIDIICNYYFAPTEKARENLKLEGKKEEFIFVTGNTVIDALKTTVHDEYTDENLQWVNGNRLILVTAHRRENLGEPMRDMFRAIRRLLDKHTDVKAIYPVHLNPEVREIADEILSNHPRIKLIDPLDVLRFHNYMSQSYLVLTDSGGIQEEAPALGKPVLVMRNTTERPEGVEAGTLKLVGTTEEGIYAAADELLSDKREYEKMSLATNPYGDGHASERIADIISRLK